jgi:hypothetical protein
MKLGGLGVLDLIMLGYALHLRWEWLQRIEPDCMWTALPSKNDQIIQAMFDASITQARFLSDR